MTPLTSNYLCYLDKIISFKSRKKKKTAFIVKIEKHPDLEYQFSINQNFRLLIDTSRFPFEHRKIILFLQTEN